MLKPCILIPFYNHERTIAATVASLQPFGLPCFIVDDGSDASCAPTLAAIAKRESSWVCVLRHTSNRGKGAAVITGFESAHAAGFTHAVQIDADQQHDIGDLPALLALARQEPSALVIGIAEYDASVPGIRRWARHLTHFWVHVNTLSFQIRDSLCGFRIYPLPETLAVCRNVRLGQRMEFDIEIAVRLLWSGVQVRGLPTRVTYPRDGVSHFRMLRDNARISATHARLFFGMLWRMPRLLARRRATPRAGAAA